MIIELKTKIRLISNRRNRMLLTLVSPVWVTLPLGAISDAIKQAISRALNAIFTNGQI